MQKPNDRILLESLKKVPNLAYRIFVRISILRMMQVHSERTLSNLVYLRYLKIASKKLKTQDIYIYI